ncbi:MAG: TonB-dependent receptor plug domain-containing protein, partial [Pseudomonadota bacterium]
MTGSSQFSVQIVRTKNVVRGDLSQRYFTPNTVLAVLASLAAAALTTPVSAQENEPFLEEIIVTAQKRADNLQDTSLSITAFSADRLNQLGIENVTDLRNAVPGLTINDSVTPFISIRGVSSNSDLPTGDPAVATHINGVYVGRPSATRGAFYDLERIEVLRGPQGILYGRNATGGSINIISRRPDFERAANFKTELGNFSRYGISGAANVVLAEDELALRVAATYDQRDSFANTGAVSDRSYGNALDELGFRIQALYAPNEDSSLLLGYSKYTNDGGVAASTVIPAPAGYDPFNVSLNTEPIFEDDQDMFWLEANYELDWAQFTYLGSWFDNSIFNQTDFDGGDMLQQIGLRHLSGEQVSHEFRLSSVSGDEWDW